MAPKVAFALKPWVKVWSARAKTSVSPAISSVLRGQAGGDRGLAADSAVVEEHLDQGALGAVNLGAEDLH